MKNDELIRAYTISIFIISFLDEYGKLERLGSFAKVYNTIIKKNNIFQDQIYDFQRKKRKKISHKAELFFIAKKISLLAWDKNLKESTGTSISAGTTISNLFRLNKEHLTKIYGFDEIDFLKINQQSQANTTLDGITFHSCKMARVLTESTLTIISEQLKNSGINHD